MSEHAAVTKTLDREAPPPLDPDPELIAHLEGNPLALRGYRHEAEELRDAARKEPPVDG
jgi:hypothetical protein